MSLKRKAPDDLLGFILNKKVKEEEKKEEKKHCKCPSGHIVNSNGQSVEHLACQDGFFKEVIEVIIYIFNKLCDHNYNMHLVYIYIGR